MIRFYIVSLLLVILARINASPVFLILGDSLSDGHGLTEQDAWPLLIQKKGWVILNTSNAGSTLQEGVHRLRSYLSISKKDQKIHYLVIALGSNDGLRVYPVGTIERNLMTLIDIAQENDIVPIIIGWQMPPNYGPYATKFKEVFKKVAEDRNVLFIPCPLESFADDQQYFQSDGYHPNDSAQILIAENILNGLKGFIVQ